VANQLDSYVLEGDSLPTDDPLCPYLDPLNDGLYNPLSRNDKNQRKNFPFFKDAHKMKYPEIRHPPKRPATGCVVCHSDLLLNIKDGIIELNFAAFTKAFNVGDKLLEVARSYGEGNEGLWKHLVRDKNLLHGSGELVPSARKALELLLSLTRKNPYTRNSSVDLWKFDGFELGAINFYEFKDWNVTFFNPKKVTSGLLIRLDTTEHIRNIKYFARKRERELEDQDGAESKKNKSVNSADNQQ
jgi:hypothetical protein